MTLPGWLADPGLCGTWEVLHTRLERHGPTWRGRVTLTALDASAQRALSGLLGRTVVRSSVTVDLVDLEERVATAGGLGRVVEAATGRRLVDRRSERERAAALREAPVLAAAALLPDADWVTGWLAEVRRLGPDVAAAEAAARVLLALQAGRPVSRVDLAAQVLGDAHGLDEDGQVSGLVLRGLAASFGVEVPLSAGGRRDLWRMAGVSGDEVSSTCLVLRLPLITGALAARIAGADPIHLTRRDLARHPLDVPAGTRVLVCENPRVLEAIADAELDVAVVCVSGNPTLVSVDVLRALARCGAILDYHGDFDWPGLAIANRLVALVGARPWAMSSADYRAAPDGGPLRGLAVEATWDAGLTPAMRARGLAIHEEAVLSDLLERLRNR